MRSSLGVALASLLALPLLAGAVTTVPDECRTYTSRLADDREHAFAWNQLLSLAACIQDASIARVDDESELAPMLDGLVTELETSVMVYVAAMESGPRPVQLRAAYQLAMLCVNTMVRARSAIVAPPDLHANPAAEARFHALHAELEAQLEPLARSARRAFLLIDRQATRDPSVAPDAVTRHMVASARSMIVLLAGPVDESRR